MPTDGRNAQTPPRSLTICDPDPFSAGSLPTLPHSATTCSINTRCRQNCGNLTGQREREDMPGSVCASVCPCARALTCSQSKACSCTDAGYPENRQLMKPNISSMEKGSGQSSISNILLEDKRTAACYRLPRGPLDIFASYSAGEGYSLPEHFSELFELVVGHLRADGFQPLWHKALPQWLTYDIIRYQTKDSVQALLQLGHCGTGLVPVSSHLGNGVNGLWYMLSAAVMLAAPYICF